jgi:CheY-like chemotaxis protein
MPNSVVGVFVNDKVEHFIYAKNIERLGSRTECHFFTNLHDGVPSAIHHAFDVVVIDLHFSGENFGGISILKHLKDRSDKKMLAVAITPLLQKGDLETVMDAGFSFCIEKPVAYEALEVLLRKRIN